MQKVKGKRKMYAKVSQDKYELILAFGDTVGELADIVGVKKDSLLSMISHNRGGYIRIEYEDDEEMTDTEIIGEIRAELRKQKMTCRRCCGTWNATDRDCEIYGYIHPSPANCSQFINRELTRRKQ